MFLKAKESTTQLLGTRSHGSKVQSRKALWPIEVSPEGSEVRAREVQPWKALPPMEVSPEGSEVRARAVQP